METRTSTTEALKPSNIAFLGAILFLVVFGLFNVAPAHAALNHIAFLFHIVMFGLVATLAAPAWARFAGFGWLFVDMTVDVININAGAAAATIAMPMRLGSHIALAIWVFGAAWPHGGMLRGLGIVAALLLGGYSLVAPWVPPTVFLVAGAAFFIWIVTMGYTVRNQPAGAAQPATRLART